MLNSSSAGGSAPNPLASGGWGLCLQTPNGLWWLEVRLQIPAILRFTKNLILRLPPEDPKSVKLAVEGLVLCFLCNFIQ